MSKWLCNLNWKKQFLSEGDSIVISSRVDVFVKCEFIHFFLKLEHGTFI